MAACHKNKLCHSAHCAFSDLCVNKPGPSTQYGVRIAQCYVCNTDWDEGFITIVCCSKHHAANMLWLQKESTPADLARLEAQVLEKYQAWSTVQIDRPQVISATIIRGLHVLSVGSKLVT